MFNWDESPDLNITPLVDIMLVLLAILMVTTPTLIYQDDINLPSGSQNKSVKSIPKLEISIDKNKTIKLKNQSDIQRFSYAELVDNLVLLDVKKDTPVFLKADKSLLYEDVMSVLKGIKNAGFKKVSLETGG